MLAKHDAKEMKVHFEIDIQASPEQVWAQLASMEGMNQWFSKRLIFEFVEGGEFRMEVSIPEEGDFTFFGEVLKIDPFHELAFTWTEHEKGKDPWPIFTVVNFKLSPVEKGTRVSLTHSGFEKLDSAIALKEFEGHIVGWERANSLTELKEVVEASLG